MDHLYHCYVSHYQRVHKWDQRQQMISRTWWYIRGRTACGDDSRWQSITLVVNLKCGDMWGQKDEFFERKVVPLSTVILWFHLKCHGTNPKWSRWHGLTITWLTYNIGMTWIATYERWQTCGYPSFGLSDVVLSKWSTFGSKIPYFGSPHS